MSSDAAPLMASPPARCETQTAPWRHAIQPASTRAAVLRCARGTWIQALKSQALIPCELPAVAHAVHRHTVASKLRFAPESRPAPFAGFLELAPQPGQAQQA